MVGAGFVASGTPKARGRMGALRAVSKPMGEFSVGVIDVELPRRSDHGAVVRMFYPTESPAREPLRWLPSFQLTRGLLKFSGQLPKWLLGPVSWGFYMVLGRQRIPGASIAPPIASLDNEKKLPVVIFSHGLGANRAAYTLFCRDVASDGHVVLYLEHRDGSASSSFFTDEKTGKRTELPNSRLPPGSTGEQEFEFRNRMIVQRGQEVERVYEFAEQLNRGEAVVNLLDSDRSMSQVLAGMQDRLDMNRVCVSGHSFGGGTAVFAVHQSAEKYACCVCLDPWFFPLAPELRSPDSPPLTLPLLIIHNELMYWPRNLEWVGNVYSRATGEATSIGLRDAAHQLQADFHTTLPPWMARAFRLSKTGYDDELFYENNAITMQFLRKHLQPPVTSLVVSKYPDVAYPYVYTNTERKEAGSPTLVDANVRSGV